jgi:glycosyltransferase involved in cell wall biosynthesis
VRAFDPDVVHIHFGYSGLAVPPVRAPIVTMFCGDDLNGTWSRRGGVTLRSRLGILVSQITALRSARCITVSSSLRDRLWSAARRRAVVLQDPVDDRLFRPIPQSDARRRLGISPEDRLVIFPHDASQPTKRVSLAQDAVARLRTMVPSARLWIVNGVPPDDMVWHYAAADLLIITSALEGGPSSAKEALACGLPVVSVPVGDLELFQDAPHGAVIADASPEALSEAMHSILSRAAEPRQSLLPGRLTWREALPRLIQVYVDVASRVATPPSSASPLRR